MKDRAYYEALFDSYPAVVTIPVCRKMIGGISKENMQYLIDSNQIKHLFSPHATYLPKEYIIDYLLSEHYQSFQTHLLTPV